MFERAHHQRIAQVLSVLNGPLLRENHCLFGGGTAIVLRYGEYRESLDLDFLVSDVGGYRNLRLLLTDKRGIGEIVRAGTEPLVQDREVRADQYGLRTILRVSDQLIKFEIVLEGRIELAIPEVSDEVCGISTLTPLDMATSKLLANSDRWADDGVFNRDVIDLALMKPSLLLLRNSVTKAENVYGKAIRRDLDNALQRLQNRPGWLERCIQTLAIDLPKALVWQRIRALRRVLR